MINVLFTANELNYTCGVTNHLLHLSKALTGTGKVKLAIICGGGNGTDRFKDIDAEIITDQNFLHLNRNINKYLSGIISLVKFIKKHQINIIHSHYHYGASIAAKAAALTGAATVQTNHGILESTGRLKHFNAEHYIAINPHIEKYLIKKEHIKHERVHFIRCGIPVPFPMPLKTIKGKLKILAAARFTHSKGLDVYIKAVNMLPLNIFNYAEFYIAGSGELESELRTLNNSLGNKVIFEGNILNMYDYLKNINILVNNSISDTEGFPAIITEAGATNTLVITSDFMGAQNVIKQGLNGLMYRNNNTENLYQILTDAVYNYNNYKPVSKIFYEFIRKNYRVEEMAEKHLALYTNCTKRIR